MYRIKDFFRNIKYAWQRATRGYDDLACWNINNWFLEMMPKLLDHMIYDRCGHPLGLTEDKWTEILSEMKHCFVEANEDTCSLVNEYGDDHFKLLEKWLYAKNENGDITVVPNYDEEDELLVRKWIERNDEISAYREKMLNKGLNLFKKYFWSLWD